MNKRFLTVVGVLLLGVVSSYAQLAQDAWVVYDVNTGKEERVTPKDTGETSYKVVAKDDRKDITGKATGYEKAAVVLSAGEGICSGSMVGPNVVLTAAHCLYVNGKYSMGVEAYATGLPPTKQGHSSQPNGNGKPQKSAKPGKGKLPTPPVGKPGDNKKKPARGFRQAAAQDPAAAEMFEQNVAQRVKMAGPLDRMADLRSGKFPSAKSVKFWVPEKYIRLVNSGSGDRRAYDYGLIILDDTLGNKTGLLGVAVPTDASLKQATIVVVGRSRDQEHHSLSENPGTIGKIDRTYIYHDADMLGGNSGGPIMFARDKSKVIALSNFGSEEGRYPNGGLRITQEVVNAVSQNTRQSRR